MQQAAHAQASVLTILFNSATRNANESPFLRLPAELRNRIYFAALGGHVLHPSAKQSRNPLARRVQWRVLTLLGTHELTAHATITTHLRIAHSDIAPAPNGGGTSVNGDADAARHADFTGLAPLYRLPPLPVFRPLSRVCRQMHAETALLPFVLNVFEFWNKTDMARWVRGATSPLLPAQRRAVTHMLTVDLPAELELAELEGLRNIYVGKMWCDGKFVDEDERAEIWRAWAERVGKKIDIVRPTERSRRGELVKIVLDVDE